MKRVIFAAACAALASACVPPADLTAIEAEVANFHAKQAAGDDAGIFADASDGFQAAATEDVLKRLNDSVRALEGCTPPQRDQARWNNNMSTSGHFITVVYTRTCSHGPLEETFMHVITPDGPKLHNYNVAGMALFPPATPTQAPTDATPEAQANETSAPATTP